MGQPLLTGALAFFIARALRRGEAASLGELTRAGLRRAARPAPLRLSGEDEPEGPALDRPGERIELWPVGEVWRWRYRDEAGLTLTANRAVRSEEEAVEAARLAYPGVDRVVVPGPPPPPARAARAALRRWGRAAAAGSLLLVAALI